MPGSKRKAGVLLNRRTKRSKLAVLEEKMENMFQVLLDKIEDKKAIGESSNSDSEQSSEGSVPEADLNNETLAWEAPTLVSAQEKQLLNLEALSLVPQVKESAPQIPPPTPEIKAQGIACQKLGTPSWNKIRYKDVQKKLQASPMFDALRVNNQLEGLVHKSFGNSILERTEEMAGIITHGLLKQRQKIAEGMQNIVQKCPEAYNEIKENSLGESAFKEVSDDLLHYTCAKRAELVEMRRKTFKPKDQHLATKLAEIPPSESHLFDEEALSRFFDQRGGFQKVFFQGQKTLKEGDYRDT